MITKNITLNIILLWFNLTMRWDKLSLYGELPNIWDVPRVRRVVATTGRKCSIKCVYEIILHWLVTNSGG